MFQPITEQDNQLAQDIVDAAYKVHIRLGPGLLEKIYEHSFCYELDKKKKVEEQVSLI